MLQSLDCLSCCIYMLTLSICFRSVLHKILLILLFDFFMNYVCQLLKHFKNTIAVKIYF